MMNPVAITVNTPTARYRAVTRQANRTFAVLAVASALAVCQVQAQTVYRVVGPDGKVTFTDRPPTADDIRSPNTGSPAARSTASPAPQPEKQLATPTAPTATAKRASAPTAATPAAPTATPAGPDPDLLRAVVVVLGHEDLVKRTEELCVRTLPTSMKRYGDAAQGWHQRNATWVAKARTVLATMAPAVQQGVREKIESTTLAQLRQVQDAAMAPRIKWCDSAMDEMKGGVVDLGGKPTVSIPLGR